jgi:FemAB family
MLAINHSPHFLQTQSWADFWLEVNPDNHDYHWLTTTIGEFELRSLIYEFPWQLGEKFWYIPKAGTLNFTHDYSDNPKLNCWDQISATDLEVLTLKHLNQAYEEAKKNGLAFVKFDLNDGLTNRLNLSSNQFLLEFCQSKLDNKCQLSTKKIQYLSTFVADLRSIPVQNYDQILNLSGSDKLVESQTNLFNSPFAVSNLTDFWEESKAFWSGTNTNIRRYTKKVLQSDWIISMTKSENNFEAFWKVYNSTKDRQNFKIHSKDYVKNLFDKPETHLIVMYDLENNPQSAWLGYQWCNNLVYLYGGNEEYSFNNHGQYLMHLAAIYLARCLKLDFYDLGGWESNTGYGKFKEQYKAEFRQFLGPIDLPTKPFKFKVINTMVNLAKKIKK